VYIFLRNPDVSSLEDVLWACFTLQLIELIRLSGFITDDIHIHNMYFPVVCALSDGRRSREGEGGRWALRCPPAHTAPPTDQVSPRVIGGGAAAADMAVGLAGGVVSMPLSSIIFSALLNLTLQPQQSCNQALRIRITAERRRAGETRRTRQHMWNALWRRIQPRKEMQWKYGSITTKRYAVEPSGQNNGEL